ncbi:S8 family serine peptidase [Jannaschia donghaensis]|uniref:Minor extracellular protease epr n=1 Tax=Jannaschia donghaensis TaxID=420998 RepID=A0A0M6YFX7_9RHOB|nr:S8 family serine peptidase [Jannaschia donghaensis]CTQ48575.1 Minor extracellular protease epr precursor [Jannaschia donghaensis]
MRHILILCLALAACVPAGQPGRDPRGPAFAVVDPRELIVLTAEDPQILIERAKALGYTLRDIHRLPDLADTLVVLRIPVGTTIPQAIDAIESAVPGVTAGANHIYRLQVGAIGDRDYAAAMIGWPAGGCRARIRIGLIDAGVGSDHTGLADGRIEQRAFNDSIAPPATDHGALMAELLVGPERLHDTVLYSANVIDPDRGAGDAAGVVSILRGVDWLAANGVDIVNISLAGPRNKLMDRALGRAAADGMVLVAAVGNLGPGQPPQYPAAFPFALAVTAVDRDGDVYRRAIRGPHVDIAAPGVDILVASENGVTVSSGTSMAAPFVTSVIAADPALADLSLDALRAELARRATDLGAVGRDTVFGAGLLRGPARC